MRNSLRPKRLTRGLLASILSCFAAAGAPPAARRALASPSEDADALIRRTIANQHKNDDALAIYERRERRTVFKHSEDASPADDKTYRVVPTGTGTLRLLVEERGQTVVPEMYRKELRDLEQALVWALDPTESKQKQRVAKWEKRTRERAQLVDAVKDAFRFTWQGRETLDGRLLAKITFEPSPSFSPHVKNADLFQHVRGTMWIEESEAQLVRLEAEIATDISVFGGVLGKIYHGGRFTMEQIPVADGVWLPSRIQYDFSGRRFVFGFEMHEVTLAGGYRRIGGPKDALAAIRQELSGAAPAAPAK